MEFFKRNSEFIGLPIWEHVFNLQDDWDITIKEASIVLIQLCANRKAIKYFSQIKGEKDNKRFVKMFNKMAKGQQDVISNMSSAKGGGSIYNNHLTSRASLPALQRLV